MAYYILKSYKLKLSALEIFGLLKDRRNCFFLDSGLNSDYSLGRYSFLGIDPFFVLKTKGIDPFPELRRITDSYRINIPKVNIPFLGGAVGYFSYDLGLMLEKIKLSVKEHAGIPDCCFGFYGSVIIVDHLKRLLYVLATGFPERNSYLARKLANSNFKSILQLLSGKKSPFINKSNPRRHNEELRSNFSKEEYIRAIREAKAYIKAGDIYQVNLSQEFRARSSLLGYEIYKRLRKISPSYFSAYLDCEDFQILSSSPERFLKLEGNIVSTRPMKGTRPRGKGIRQDSYFRKSLLMSAKDKAELMMIVDLERNDLGRVCRYDSIRVEALREIEEYSTVFQTTATISGALHRNKDRIDLLRACFPGGSITGCPKIRSMQIIEELEPVRRKIYTGALGYLSFSGSMDFNILIRTILKKREELYFSSGGGIVADSNPQEEYEETMVKAKAMMGAINAE